MQTLEQQRAAHAWNCVQGSGKEYTNLAKGAPALIMNNGLMQALAFYQSKGKDYHQALNRHILDWLNERRLVPDVGFENAMEALCRAEPPAYRRATQEALELLKWIRQFAAAVAREE